MVATQQRTLFAIDPGSTNWRLYRAVYELEGGRARLLAEPAPAPLTSFTDRSLPAALILNQPGDGLSCYGETAYAQLETQQLRDRFRACFKPSINDRPPTITLADQRYTQEEALTYTRLMLAALLEGLRREKWPGSRFTEEAVFSFAHPVHWGIETEGQILQDFEGSVLAAFQPDDQPLLRFVSEPEAAIYSLQHGELLPADPGQQVALILDVGGSTTDLVASELGAGEPVFLARYGGALGGELYDTAVAEYMARVLSIPSRVLEQDLALAFKLRSIAQQLKEGLSRQLLQNPQTPLTPQRTVTVVGAEGEVYRGVIELDEDRFQEITQAIQVEFIDLINRAFKAMGLVDREIGRVILVGGGSQLFSIINYLRARFGENAILLADNPAECVVRGVSLEYGAAMAERRPTLLFMESSPSRGEPAAIRWELISKEGHPIALQPGTLRVGRAPTNDIHIASDRISRWHAELIVSDSGCSLKDLGSTNGSYLDEQRLSAQAEVPLLDGARLRFGDQNFVLRKIEFD
ncbi:MAG: FHA domain-containing protein [Anaerolineales bacterium]